METKTNSGRFYMKNFYNLLSAALILFAVAGIFALGWQLKSNLNVLTLAETRTEEKRAQVSLVQTVDSWLKGTTDEKLAQIEKHLRGLDVAMAEIGYRYGELHHAAKERNWDYAKYQTEKIDLAMRLALDAARNAQLRRRLFSMKIFQPF